MRLCGKIIAKFWILTIIIIIMIISGGQTKRIPAVVLSGEDFTYNLKGLSNNTYYNVVIRFVQVDRIDWTVGWVDEKAELLEICLFILEQWPLLDQCSNIVAHCSFLQSYVIKRRPHIAALEKVAVKVRTVGKDVATLMTNVSIAMHITWQIHSQARYVEEIAKSFNWFWSLQVPEQIWLVALLQILYISNPRQRKGKRTLS